MSALRGWFELGGPLMWPLLVSSVVLLALLVERAWTLGVVAPRRQLARGERMLHRRWLPFFVEVPPAVGLLGTVVGVVGAFGLEDGRMTATGVGGGLAAACVTTVFGLSIGITAHASMHVLNVLSAPRRWDRRTPRVLPEEEEVLNREDAKARTSETAGETEGMNREGAKARRPIQEEEEAGGDESDAADAMVLMNPEASSSFASSRLRGSIAGSGREASA